MMRANRVVWTAAGMLALMLGGGAGWNGVAAAQAKTPTAQAKKPAPKAAPKPGAKAPARKAAPVARRTRGQAAPTRDRIVEIQDALAREGFYSGAPSGKWDAPTSAAMRNFQTSKGLTPTGKLGALSLQKLGFGSEIAGKGAPVAQADTRPSILRESELNQPEQPEAKEQ